MALNHVPDNVPELMKRDFGTSVLITDTKSDYYLDKYRENMEKNGSDSKKQWR